MVAALVATSPVATLAQDDPGLADRIYSSRSTPRAPTNKTAAELENEARQATAFEAACDTGSLDACSNLGEAYELGVGKPQNRPVAAILYSEACEAGHATSCYRFGRVTDAASYENSAIDAVTIFRKSCDKGSLEGCAAYAEALRQGHGVEPDSLQAESLIRDTCDKGGREACRLLAISTLAADSETSDMRMAIGLLERGCREGRVDDCDVLIAFTRGRIPFEGQMTRAEVLDLACIARDAGSCAELGDMALTGEDIPQDYNRAVKLHDLACEHADDTMEKGVCEMAQTVRRQPAIQAQCATGDVAACSKLGLVHNDLGSAFYDADKALELLGQGCQAGIVEVCHTAALIALNDLAHQDPQAALAHLEKGCAAEQDLACEILAKELDSGERLSPDQSRAYAIYSALCSDGYTNACEFLEERVAKDSNAPLPIADARYIPPHDPDNPDATLAYVPKEKIEEGTSKCSSSTVEFRGRTYTDRVCDARVRMRRGYELQPGAAPWQALLWRPARMQGMTLAPAGRVACGGTVIATGWILTAAHCLLEKRGDRYFKIPYSEPATGYTIRLGVHNPREDEGLLFPITDIFLHPLFNIRNNYVFDIGLIRYDHAAGRKLGTETQKIGVLRPDPQPANGESRRKIVDGMPAYAYGWGWTEATNSSSTTGLRGAKLLLESENECSRITRFTGKFLNSALCAAGSEGQQACYGDSGGPLVYYGPPGTRPVVIGVVSAGKECGVTGEPSRYTRVAAAREWIDQVMGQPSR